MASSPGWYPDPKSGGQRYFNGKDWTSETAPAPASPYAPPPQPSAPQKKPLGCFKTVLGLIGIIFVIGIIGNSCSHEDKNSSSSASSSSSSEESGTTTTPSVPKPPPAQFTTGTDGSVTAAFSIQDNFTEGMIKDGGRFDTIDILKYAKAHYPNAPSVTVKGSFPMKDAFGNTSTDVVVNLTYLRSTLDQINFEGVDKDKIWEIADDGFIAPAFRP